MSVTKEDIFEFISNWRKRKNISSDRKLTVDEITLFVGELEELVAKMDYSQIENTGVTIVGYSGSGNDAPCWRIVEYVTKEINGSDALYISMLPAGKLLNVPDRTDLEEAIRSCIDKNINTDMLIGGWNDGERIGSKCGYGDYLSLDDFVSYKLMSEAEGVNENIIVFSPGEIDPNKVFAQTEAPQIFANNAYKYINGISKSGLESIYNSGDMGKNAFYQIISRVSREVIGDVNMG